MAIKGLTLLTTFKKHIINYCVSNINNLQFYVSRRMYFCYGTLYYSIIIVTTLGSHKTYSKTIIKNGITVPLIIILKDSS